jgi:hypothetical protein
MDFQDEGFGSVERGFPHPFVAFFHVFFRTMALVVYLMGSLIYSASFIGIFVSVVLLLSLDFWTVKNITGRILVNLVYKCDNVETTQMSKKANRSG